MSNPLKFNKDLKPIKRECPNCSAIIESRFLKQCPICFTTLPPLPSFQQKALNYFLSTGKRIIPENFLKSKYDDYVWNFKKEALLVFFNAIVYFLLLLFIMNSIYVSLDPTLYEIPFGGLPVNTVTIFLSQLGTIFIGIYPIYYISRYRYSWSKLGINEIKINKIKENTIFGLISGIMFLFFNYIIGYLFSLIYSPPNTIVLEKIIIKKLPFIQLIAYIFIFFAAEVSVEVLFRGVIHRSLADYMGTSYSTNMSENINNKIKVDKIKINKTSEIENTAKIIIISALINSGFYLFISMNLYLFFVHLFSSIFIGVFFELANRSLWSIISMKFYYVIGFIIMLFI